MNSLTSAIWESANAAALSGVSMRRDLRPVQSVRSIDIGASS